MRKGLLSNVIEGKYEGNILMRILWPIFTGKGLRRRWVFTLAFSILYLYLSFGLSSVSRVRQPRPNRPRLRIMGVDFQHFYVMLPRFGR
jgi:hypothetical protein